MTLVFTLASAIVLCTFAWLYYKKEQQLQKQEASSQEKGEECVVKNMDINEPQSLLAVICLQWMLSQQILACQTFLLLKSIGFRQLSLPHLHTEFSF